MDMDVIYSFLVKGQVKKLYFIDADTRAKSLDMPQKMQTLNSSYKLSAFASKSPKGMSAPAFLYVQCKSRES